MTLTTHTMEWLNQNRERAYPLVRDKWRSLAVVQANPALDCAVLDAVMFDSSAGGSETLVLKSISVTKSATSFSFRYGDADFGFSVSGGETSGEGSFECLSGVVNGASASISCSSHAYILEELGEGSWEIGCEILPARVLRLSDGTGVRSIGTNGSAKVSGNETACDLTGDIVLEDGYRTSPIVKNGKVLVRVGTRYGYNPCNYDFGDAGSTNCSEPLFFFCGQNAINSGNIVLSGGRGVSVTQGGTYTIDNSKGGSSYKSACGGRKIPCIEIVAGQELLELYGA